MKNQAGWSTIETLFTIPLIAAALTLAANLSMVMKAKLNLQYATGVAANVYAKTNDCGSAQGYFNANFAGGSATCGGGETVEIIGKYTYPGANWGGVGFGAINLEAKAYALKEEIE